MVLLGHFLGYDYQLILIKAGLIEAFCNLFYVKQQKPGSNVSCVVLLF